MTKGITCSNSDLRSILSSIESIEYCEQRKKPQQRRRTLALLHRGTELCGFLDPSNAKDSKARSLSLVTWDSEAKLAIDPTIIGTSIEAYLSGKLSRLDEESEDQNSIVQPSRRPSSMSIKITRHSIKAQIEASHV